MGSNRDHNWTAERVEMACTLWREGYTASQVAMQLGGVSRSAVLGKLNRLGVGRRDAPPRQPLHVRMRQRRRQEKGERAYFRQPAARLLKTEQATEQQPLHVKLLDLGPHDCRWPFGDRPNYTFCGARQAADSSYCPTHRAMSLRSGTQKDFDRMAGRAMHGKLWLGKAVVLE